MAIKLKANNNYIITMTCIVLSIVVYTVHEIVTNVSAIAPVAASHATIDMQLSMPSWSCAPTPWGHVFSTTLWCSASLWNKGTEGNRED